MRHTFDFSSPSSNRNLAQDVAPAQAPTRIQEKKAKQAILRRQAQDSDPNYTHQEEDFRDRQRQGLCQAAVLVQIVPVIKLTAMQS